MSCVRVLEKIFVCWGRTVLPTKEIGWKRRCSSVPSFFHARPQGGRWPERLGRPALRPVCCLLSPPASRFASPAWSLLSWQPKALGLGAPLSHRTDPGLSREPLLPLRPGGWAAVPGEPCPLTGSRVPSQSVVRTCRIRSFGHFVARLQGSVLQFSAEAGIFVSTAQSEREGVQQQAQAQLRMVSRPSPLAAPTRRAEHPGRRALDGGAGGAGVRRRD